MINKVENIILTAGSSTGVVFGVALTDVYTVLGIILTALNLGILLFTLIRNIYYRMKDGNFDKKDAQDTAMEILQLTDKVKELQEKLKEKEGDGNGNRN